MRRFDHTGSEDPGRDRRFRLAVAGYLGILVGGCLTTIAAATGSATAADASPTHLVLVGTVGLVTGIVGGAAVTGRVSDPAVRVGRRRRPRLTVAAPAAAFASVALIDVLGAVLAGNPLDSIVGYVALASAFAIALAGWIVGSMAETRYVDATVGERVLSVRWAPSVRPKLELAALVAWLALALVNAIGGEWTAAVAWTVLGLLWAASAVVEGRWRFIEVGTPPAIRIHEAGLVKRRPFSQSLVPWSSVGHVRLREDELVLDRGIVDVRVGRDEAADLEALYEAIERTLARRDGDVIPVFD